MASPSPLVYARPVLAGSLAGSHVALLAVRLLQFRPFPTFAYLSFALRLSW
jgi:hypothetical protein